MFSLVLRQVLGLRPGYELRISVDRDLVLSHLFRDAEVNALPGKSVQYRADFERIGWTLDTEPLRRPPSA